MDDNIDALIRYNRQLLALAETIREQCRERRLRCHEALRSAAAVCEQAVERQQRSGNRAEFLTRPLRPTSRLGPRGRVR